MNTQVNWQKIRTEFNRLADVDALKTEVQRIGTEIRNFDFHTVLSPVAQQKVKAFEKRYSVLMRNLSQAQRQVDREFNRILRELQTRRKDVNKVVAEQKSKLEEVTKQLRKNFAARSNGAAPKAKGSKKRAGGTAAKSTAKKRKKA